MSGTPNASIFVTVVFLLGEGAHGVAPPFASVVCFGHLVASNTVHRVGSRLRKLQLHALCSLARGAARLQDAGDRSRA